MKITQVTLLQPKHKDNPELIHVVDIVFERMLKLKDIELCKSDRGYYINFPKSHYSGYEVFHTVDRQMRNYIFKTIVDAYVKQ